VLAEFARKVPHDFVVIVKFNLEQSIRQTVGYNALNFNYIIFSHYFSPGGRGAPAALPINSN
jgi:hypothetical protein